MSLGTCIPAVMTYSMMFALCSGEWTCLWNQFKCSSSNLCIDRKLACDGIRNCPDGDDEKHCGTCDSNHFLPVVGKIKSRLWCCYYGGVRIGDFRPFSRRIRRVHIVRPTITISSPYGSSMITVRRYAMHGLSYRNSVCPSLCPSVRPSVTLVHCVHMVRPTIMISSPYGSSIILVSADITFIEKFEGGHPERGR